MNKWTAIHQAETRCKPERSSINSFSFIATNHSFHIDTGRYLKIFNAELRRETADMRTSETIASNLNDIMVLMGTDSAFSCFLL